MCWHMARQFEILNQCFNGRWLKTLLFVQHANQRDFFIQGAGYFCTHVFGERY